MADVQVLEERLEGVREDVADHEKRLRILEVEKWKLAAAILVLSTGGSTVGGLIQRLLP